MSEIKHLSKTATDEILGDDLCFLVAFGKNGEMIPFFRHIEKINEECCENINPLDFIDINFKDMPDECFIDGMLGGSQTSNAVRLMRRKKLCDDGSGVWVDCSPNPC